MAKSQKTKTWDILESLARQAKVHIDPSKVQFGDGYFIFEYGKDMVVWFYIDECPGWRFAIWWNVWKERNRRLFNSRRSSPEAVGYIIRKELALWVKHL